MYDFMGSSTHVLQNTFSICLLPTSIKKYNYGICADQNSLSLTKFTVNSTGLPSPYSRPVATDSGC
jgi:hypothetical protein